MGGGGVGRSSCGWPVGLHEILLDRECLMQGSCGPTKPLKPNTRTSSARKGLPTERAGSGDLS